MNRGTINEGSMNRRSMNRGAMKGGTMNPWRGDKHGDGEQKEDEFGDYER